MIVEHQNDENDDKVDNDDVNLDENDNSRSKSKSLS